MDKCPNDAEDKDGYQDADGCPDPDNDHDGVMDAVDHCPNQAGGGSKSGCPETPTPPPAAKPPAPEVVPPAPNAASGNCRPTSELVLSSRDMPAEVVKCLEEAAALLPVGLQAWSDEVVLRVTRTALPAPRSTR